ncbi:c-type cytochrome [Nannocystis pusilla]|uniref:c-type cytochrome n=1 Tax=Nannocystis pusilla TaxID=889268 RepID=UPI003B80CE00
MRLASTKEFSRRALVCRARGAVSRGPPRSSCARSPSKHVPHSGRRARCSHVLGLRQAWFPGPRRPRGRARPRGTENRRRHAVRKHCAKCHGALGKGKDDTPAVVGEAALARFVNAQDLFDYISKEMPEDNPGSLKEGEYWAIVAFDLKANGVDADETVGPQNASTFMLHSEGDKADDKQDAAKGDHTDDRVSSDVNE